jgi:arylsulfatase A
VPLLLKLPDSWGRPARVEGTAVSTFDVLPTTLGLLGEPVPAEVFGHDLSPLLTGTGPTSDAPRTVVSHGFSKGVYLYTAIEWPWKLDERIDRDDGIRRKLFHLEQDPSEERDVSAEHPDVVAHLGQTIEEWRALETARRLDEEQPEVDSQLL